MLDIPLDQRKALLQLTATTCHWPVGHPGAVDFFFCGGVSVEDRPYCRGHCHVAYQSTRKRQPDNDRRRFNRFGGRRPGHTMAVLSP